MCIFFFTESQSHISGIEQSDECVAAGDEVQREDDHSGRTKSWTDAWKRESPGLLHLPWIPDHAPLRAVCHLDGVLPGSARTLFVGVEILETARLRGPQTDQQFPGHTAAKWAPSVLQDRKGSEWGLSGKVMLM